MTYCGIQIGTVSIYLIVMLKKLATVTSIFHFVKYIEPKMRKNIMNKVTAKPEEVINR